MQQYYECREAQSMMLAQYTQQSYRLQPFDGYIGPTLRVWPQICVIGHAGLADMALSFTKMNSILNRTKKVMK
jgi:hypothetical protein